MSEPVAQHWPRPVPLVGDKTSARSRAADVKGWAFSPEERAVLYQIIGARRDVRRFRSEEVAPELLDKLLAAAHGAPSVGHSQPWRFVVVREQKIRDAAAAIAARERLRQAELMEEAAQRQMRDLKLEGLRDAPLGIVVCCDRRAPKEGVLGRATFGDADLWSCACAIENLWLAARAEGLGLGWVTLFPPQELAELIGLPEGVETLGWLCIGWPDERESAPGLERAGWSHRLSLAEVVSYDRWPSAAPEPPASRLKAPSPRAFVAARDRADQLLSAPSSLGVLDLSLDRLGALAITSAGPGELVLAGADHLVAHHGVSTFPQSVTREVLQASLSGQSLGAAAARSAGMTVLVIDAGVNGPVLPGAIDLRQPDERGDLLESDALSIAAARALLVAGERLGRFGTKSELVALGEVGIANTTVAAALACGLLGLSPEEAVGLGVGADHETLQRKRAVVSGALARARSEHGERLADPLVALAALGGPELAVLAGVVLGVAERGGAIVLDGLACSLSGLIALRCSPGVAAHLHAGQLSRERAHRAVLNELGLEPLLDLRLRAGEGVGAVLGLSLLRAGLELRLLAGKVFDPPAV